MKTIAFTALHYGRPYLAQAIRSVIDHVDEYHIIYSAEGSHGFKTDAICPDNRADLIELAYRAARDKLHWHEGVFDYEGQQRDLIYEVAPDADKIIVLDSDEIWQPALIETVAQWNEVSQARSIRLPMIHYWRSFTRAILHDAAYPVRVVYPGVEFGEMTIPRNYGGGVINHMGYAQPARYIDYKLKVHGHKNEIKPDWFETVFLDKSRTRDLHPVGSDFWNTEVVNPLDYLPEWMESHPYFGTDWIE